MYQNVHFRQKARVTRMLARETADTDMVALLIRLAEAYEEVAKRNWENRGPLDRHTAGKWERWRREDF